MIIPQLRLFPSGFFGHEFFASGYAGELTRLDAKASECPKIKEGIRSHCSAMETWNFGE